METDITHQRNTNSKTRDEMGELKITIARGFDEALERQKGMTKENIQAL